VAAPDDVLKAFHALFARQAGEFDQRLVQPVADVEQVRGAEARTGAPRRRCAET